ncbi:MAG: hypothetical protein E7639_03475 [Ruminococcaceae bacterium]|nr:hypothetical protein [Oscillospiraceae bacterium]
MKKNNLCTVTMIILVFSLIVTVMMSIFTVLAGIIVKAIPPVIALLLVTVFFVWIDILYLNCYKWLNTKTIRKPKKIHNLKIKNLFLSVIMLLISCSMWAILIATVIVFRVFFEFQIYFLIVAIVAIAYTINGIFIDKALAKNV